MTIALEEIASSPLGAQSVFVMGQSYTQLSPLVGMINRPTCKRHHNTLAPFLFGKFGCCKVSLGIVSSNYRVS